MGLLNYFNSMSYVTNYFMGQTLMGWVPLTMVLVNFTIKF